MIDEREFNATANHYYLTVDLVTVVGMKQNHARRGTVLGQSCFRMLLCLKIIVLAVQSKIKIHCVQRQLASADTHEILHNWGKAVCVCKHPIAPIQTYAWGTLDLYSKQTHFCCLNNEQLRMPANWNVSSK